MNSIPNAILFYSYIYVLTRKYYFIGLNRITYISKYYYYTEHKNSFNLAIHAFLQYLQTHSYFTFHNKRNTIIKMQNYKC